MKSLATIRLSFFVFLSLGLIAPLILFGSGAGPNAAFAQSPAPEGSGTITTDPLCDPAGNGLDRMLPSPWRPTPAIDPHAITFRDSYNSDAPTVVARPNATAQTVDVVVGPNFELRFDPETVTINAGDTVRWTWATSGHSVTGGMPCMASNVFCSPLNADCPSGETSPQGFIYTRTFNQAGSFPYFCAFHCGFKMTGTVNVNQVVVQPTDNDFDGDGKADIAVYRPSAGAWFILQSSNGAFAASSFGLAADRITPGDYDGDHKTDLSVFRTSEGAWYQIVSQTGAFRATGFGAATDIPAANDFDGDGKTDIAVFRPSDGTWYLLQSSNGAFRAQTFGTNGDIPAAGDYDGDAKADFAVFRPSAAAWFVLRSSNGSFFAQQFGAAGDKPVPGDYDGDGKNDLAVFRPSDGGWYLLRSTAGFTATAFGFGTDIPTPADYDGDGKTDLGVYRDGAWYLLRSTAGFTGIGFGAIGDKPIPSAYIP